MEQILSRDNLNAAYLQVVRNKGAAGIDGMTVEELGAYLSENGESIREQLRRRKYKPQPVRRVEIPKPDGGTRNLGVPTVVDRFVQQAVAQVLTPIFEERFHDHSYGFRPNRCAQQAVLKALEMMNDGQSWVVDIDLAKFFDTVDHDKLMTIFGRTIKDGDVISVVRKFLVSGVMIDDEYEDTIVGTPQGGNISPLLANVMLNELDKELKSRGVHSDDLWRRKLRCQCGHAFAKTRWHSKSRDFTTYTYKCYDQTRTGTISARLKNGLSIEGVCRSPLVQDWKMYTMAQKVLHAVFDDPEGTLLNAAAVLGCGIAGVEQSEVLRDKEIIEEQLKKERGRYETLLDMRMNNEIPREVFGRKQQEVEKKIAELEQQMMQYGDVKPATEADVSGKLENLRRLMEQPPLPEDGEFSEEDIDKYVFGVRVYEDRFEWLLNLSPEARGELDDAGSPVYFTKLTVTPDDERAWFRMHPQWSKSNKYAELEAWIYI
ncbi:group II intron reverse transcriptase/maturase [uncultured Alistipes sp.]|uniref:group II intron reverse transcriptase/maturase n=1 Tax=uncultured Alistipes sp. TaxID=538949 RepID=UPI00322033E5